MDFDDRIAALAERVKKQKGNVLTEEACKTAFVMPFLSTLGYDVFNPMEVIPEFTADVGVKKGEKVDYAIQRDGKIIMLVECKPCTGELNTKQMSQLYRYFSVTDARFAILTNGLVYWFFSDLEQSNKMDAKPFFEFDILDYRPGQEDELKKFAAPNFDVDHILATASTLKYLNAIRREIIREIDNPSEEMVKLFTSRVYDGRFTQAAKDEFAGIVARAFKETVRELLNDRLNSALDPGTPADPDPEAAEVVADDGVETTQEEIDGFNIVRAIVREVISPSRVHMRDAKSYCAILIDDNNRRPLARLHFNSQSVKYVGVFDENKSEERVRIESLDDIFSLADRLKVAAKQYAETAVPA